MRPRSQLYNSDAGFNQSRFWLSSKTLRSVYVWLGVRRVISWLLLRTCLVFIVISLVHIQTAPITLWSFGLGALLPLLEFIDWNVLLVDKGLKTSTKKGISIVDQARMVWGGSMQVNYRLRKRFLHESETYRLSARGSCDNRLKFAR